MKKIEIKFDFIKILYSIFIKKTSEHLKFSQIFVLDIEFIANNIKNRVYYTQFFIVELLLNFYPSESFLNFSIPISVNGCFKHCSITLYGTVAISPPAKAHCAICNGLRILAHIISVSIS